MDFIMPRFWFPLILIGLLSACGSDSNPDLDGDGVANELDAFPHNARESVDSDKDGLGDNSDAFPEDATETVDSDMDGVGDNLDVFPLDASESTDSDGDGVGNVADAFPQDATEKLDSDGDGVGDVADAFPQDATEKLDSDGDGVGDVADAFPQDATEKLDSDGDGVGDVADAFPQDATEKLDSDGDGVGDVADAFPQDATEKLDSDGDGVGDVADAFPQDATEKLDSDGDGVGDVADAFPQDATESADTDGDGVGDNADLFPADNNNDGIADVYEERTVSEDSLVGTWVSFGERSLNLDPKLTGSSVLTVRETSKNYLVIRNSSSGLEMVSCTVGVTAISIQDDQVNLGGEFGFIPSFPFSEILFGTVDRNRKISAESHVEMEGSFSQTVKYQMIKISDSTAAIGSASLLVAGEGAQEHQLYCFVQADFRVLQDGETREGKGYALSLGDDSMFSLQKSGVSGISDYQSLNWGDQHFDDDNQDDLNYTIDNLDDLNFSMTFNASNDSTDVSGNVQIQLPMQ
jgi:hypothetical protein